MITPKANQATDFSRGESKAQMELNDAFRLKNKDDRWMADASCLGADFKLFFPDPGRHDSAKGAKAICRKCSVRITCLNWAKENGVMHGIWGGLSTEERKKYRVGDLNE